MRATLSEFFSPKVASLLATSPELMEGNDAEISALLCDIRGFSTVTGLLYRSYGRTSEALLLLVVLLTLATLIASKPHTSVHFYAFYATVGGAMVTPIVALYRLRVWSHFIVVATLGLIAILLLLWVSATELGSANTGFAQRIWFLLAWLFNVSVLIRYKFIKCKLSVSDTYRTLISRSEVEGHGAVCDRDR